MIARSSTSFANPAVMLITGRPDTFAGIRLVDVPAFLIAQLVGGAAGTLLLWWLITSLPMVATKVLAQNEEVISKLRYYSPYIIGETS